MLLCELIVCSYLSRDYAPWLGYPQFVSSLVDGHLDCFLFATVNTVTINMWVQVFFGCAVQLQDPTSQPGVEYVPLAVRV